MWIHLLSLGLIDGAGDEAPTPPVVQNFGGWVEYKKKPKEKKAETLATGAPAEVAVAITQPQRIVIPPRAAKPKPQLVAKGLPVARQAAAQYNAFVQRQRQRQREEEELMLLF